MQRITPIYTATDAEQHLAQDWHGGQNTMLHAVASTGALAPGAAWRDTSENRWNLAAMLGAELRDVLREIPKVSFIDHDADTATVKAWICKIDAVTDALEDGLPTFTDALRAAGVQVTA